MALRKNSRWSDDWRGTRAFWRGFHLQRGSHRARSSRRSPLQRGACGPGDRCSCTGSQSLLGVNLSLLVRVNLSLRVRVSPTRQSNSVFKLKVTLTLRVGVSLVDLSFRVGDSLRQNVTSTALSRRRPPVGTIPSQGGLSEGGLRALVRPTVRRILVVGKKKDKS